MADINVFENDLLKMELQDDILHIYYKKGLKFTIDISRSIVEGRMRFLKNKAYPILVHDQGVASIDQASKEYFVSPDGIKGATAVAFVQRTFFSKLAFNLFVSTKDSPIPVKAFVNPDEAREWLRRFPLSA